MNRQESLELALRLLLEKMDQDDLLGQSSFTIQLVVKKQDEDETGIAIFRHYTQTVQHESKGWINDPEVMVHDEEDVYAAEPLSGINKMIDLFMTDLEIRYDVHYGTPQELSPEDVRREYKEFRELTSHMERSMGITIPEESFKCGSQLRDALEGKD